MPHLRLIVAAVLVPLSLWLFLPVPSNGQSLQEKISKKERQIAAKKRKERVLTSTIETYSRRINLLQGDISTLQARQQKIEADLAAKRAELDRIQDDLRKERARLTRLRASVVGFSEGHAGRLWRAFACNLGFHALAVLEAYLTLRWLLGDDSPTGTQALVFETLNRVTTVVFKFVPFRVGVDEAVSGGLAPLLGVDAATGVSLAVIRKVRMLVWTGVGLALIGVRHARAVPEPDRPGTAGAHQP